MRWFATLRGQLATVVVVVLVVGLSVTGVTAWTVLSRSLVAEMDARLEQVAEPLAQVASRNILGDLPLSRMETESLPSDYVVVFVSADASVRRQWSSTASGVPRSAPAIRSMPLEEVLERRGEPFSVTAVDGVSRWRVIALPLASGTGSVAVALPMDTLDAASAQLKTVLVTVGTITALLGGLAGAYAVHRSLRPVREIERTAAAIASGELGSRIPVSDEGTEVGHLAASLNAMLGQLEPEADFGQQIDVADRLLAAMPSMLLYWHRYHTEQVRQLVELYLRGAPREQLDPLLEASVARYLGSDEAVSVPGELGGAPVTAIGDSAFFCVCSRYESSAPPAQMPMRMPSTPKPARLFTLKCRASAAYAVS